TGAKEPMRQVGGAFTTDLNIPVQSAGSGTTSSTARSGQSFTDPHGAGVNPPTNPSRSRPPLTSGANVDDLVPLVPPPLPPDAGSPSPPSRFGPAPRDSMTPAPMLPPTSPTTPQ